MSRAVLFGLLFCWVSYGPMGSALDDAEDPRLGSGAFLGAHFVYALADFDFGRVPATVYDPLGVEVFAGYRFNRYVSIEGLLQYLTDFDIGLADLPPGDVAEEALPPWGTAF